MELVYTSEGLFNRDIFFDEYTDINIYFVGNERKKYFYMILQKIFSRKIDGLFGLKSKDDLLRKINDLSDKKAFEKSFFIIERGFEKILGEKLLKGKNIIYLEKHDIESYFLVKEKVVEFFMNIFDLPYDETDNMLNYDIWYINALSYFKELFILKAIQEKNKIVDEENNFDKVHNNATFDVTLLNKRIDQVKYIISEKSYISIYNKICKNINSLYNNDYSYIISGLYMIKSFCEFVQQILLDRYNLNEKDLIWYLVSGIDITPLQYLKERIKY